MHRLIFTLAAAAPAPAMIAAHYLPWRKSIGRDLHRLEAYSIGTAAIVIIGGRRAANELEIFVRGQCRRGNISRDEAETLIDLIDTIRLGLMRGQAFGRKIRGKPNLI